MSHCGSSYGLYCYRLLSLSWRQCAYGAVVYTRNGMYCWGWLYWRTFTVWWPYWMSKWEICFHAHSYMDKILHCFCQTTQLSQQYTYDNLTVCQWQRFICSLAVCAKTSWSGIWNAKICKVLSFPFVHYWSWTPCNTLLWKLDERKLYVKQKECSLMYHLALLLVFRKVWRYQRISHKL